MFVVILWGWLQVVNGLDQGGKNVLEIRFRDFFHSLSLYFILLSLLSSASGKVERRDKKGG